MKKAAATLALLSIAGCLLAPILFFTGGLGRPGFEGIFLAASVGWFAGASFWATRASGGVADDVISS